MRVEFHGRGRFAVAYPLGNAVHGRAIVDHKRRAGVPLRYNNDKPEKSRIFKGFQGFKPGF